MTDDQQLANALKEIAQLKAENQGLRRDLMHAIDGIDECWDETYRHGGEETFTEMLCKKYGWDRAELRS